jgi:hypothetical protein
LRRARHTHLLCLRQVGDFGRRDKEGNNHLFNSITSGTHRGHIVVTSPTQTHRAQFWPSLVFSPPISQRLAPVLAAAAAPDFQNFHGVQSQLQTRGKCLYILKWRLETSPDHCDWLRGQVPLYKASSAALSPQPCPFDQPRPLHRELRLQDQFSIRPGA